MMHQIKQQIKKLARQFGVHLNTDDSLPTGVDWLHDIKRIALRSGDHPKIFFDVGANLGQTTMELHRAFPDGRIFAFEPFLSTYKNLCSRTAQLTGVRTFPLGFGALPALLQVPSVENSEQNSLLSKSPPEGPGSSTESVTIETLDEFCQHQKISHIDVLKTDTEGYDLEVLKGGLKLLTAGRIRFVYSEVTFAACDTQHTPFFPLHELLSSHGFRFLGIYETYPLHYAPEDRTYCNALFLNRNWKHQAAGTTVVSPPSE